MMKTFKWTVPDQHEWKTKHSLITLAIPLLILTIVSEYTGLPLSAWVETKFTTIVDIATVVIAVCALVVSVWSIRAQRHHNRLSVRPKIFPIRVGKNTDNKKQGIYLRNHGLGPALVKQIAFQPKKLNKKITNHHELQDIYSAYGFEAYDLGQYWLNVIPKDACERILWLEKVNNITESEFNEMLNGALVYVEYESMYGERYEAFNRI